MRRPKPGRFGPLLLGTKRPGPRASVGENTPGTQRLARERRASRGCDKPRLISRKGAGSSYPTVEIDYSGKFGDLYRRADWDGRAEAPPMTNKRVSRIPTACLPERRSQRVQRIRSVGSKRSFALVRSLILPALHSGSISDCPLSRVNVALPCEQVRLGRGNALLDRPSRVTPSADSLNRS